MSSGNFDTIFFKNAAPLVDDVTPFSTFSILAVGPSSIVQGYSFYDLQKLYGAPDTSTITNQLSTTIVNNISSLQSTTQSQISTITNQLNNLNQSFISTIPTTDLFSTYTGTSETYPGNIQLNSFSLGGLSSIINTGKYTLTVDFQYSLYLNTPNDLFTWVTTLGSLNTLDDPSLVYGNKGSQLTTRVGNNVYSQINNNLIFNPSYNQMPLNVSNFNLQLLLNSSINISPTTNMAPNFDIYVQGLNNFTFTLTPISSATP